MRACVLTPFRCLPHSSLVGLTDYEIRDLNDEINKLLREKNHWENQIIALGGANYKRGGIRTSDDGGQSVPGSRGYKYFGRAKDLPGVKELLGSASAAQDAAEAEERKASKYRRFLNQPPAYLGDEDEDDGVLLREEEEREAAMWSQRLQEIRDELGEDAVASEELPRRKAINVREVMARGGSAAGGDSNDVDGEAEQDAGPDGKRKATNTDASSKKAKVAVGDDATAAASSSQTLLADLLPALDAEQVSTRLDVPDRKATEAFILRERKKLLKNQYLGEGNDKS